MVKAHVTWILSDSHLLKSNLGYLAQQIFFTSTKKEKSTPPIFRGDGVEKKQQLFFRDASAGLLKSFHPPAAACLDGATINAFHNRPIQSVDLSFPEGLLDQGQQTVLWIHERVLSSDKLPHNPTGLPQGEATHPLLHFL